jgi:hypothetical protein
MRDIRRWFGWTMVIGPLHMGEQFLTGFDELHELQRFSAAYHGWFGNPEVGTVLLVTLAFTFMNVVVYGLLKGGRAALLALGAFALVAVGEVHHLVKTIAHLQYFPGAVTAPFFALFGWLLLRALIAEYRRPSRTVAAVPLPA